MNIYNANAFQMLNGKPVFIAPEHHQGHGRGFNHKTCPRRDRLVSFMANSGRDNCIVLTLLELAPKCLNF